jgi:hypothetical protein
MKFLNDSLFYNLKLSKECHHTNDHVTFSKRERNCRRNVIIQMIMLQIVFLWDLHQDSRYKLCANWTPNKRQFQCGISDNSNVDFGIVVVHALFLQVLYHMMKSPYSPWLQEHLEL